MKIKYTKPWLNTLSFAHVVIGVCMDGEEAGEMPPSCAAGQHAGGGGCGQGAAAIGKCLSGAAAEIVA